MVLGAHALWTYELVSFAGELGWELHTQVEDTPAVWDAVMAAGAPHGLRPFGMWALDSLRLEKGYRAWKQDLSTDFEDYDTTDGKLFAGLGLRLSF